MKIAARILSIGSAVIYVLTFLVQILAISLQTTLVPVLFELPDHVFMLPIAPVLSVLFMLVLAVAGIIVSFKDAPIWVNILLVAIPVLMLTPLTNAVGYYQSKLVFDGMLELRSLSVMNTFMSYITCLTPLASGAYMVSGGMRIAGSCKK